MSDTQLSVGDTVILKPVGRMIITSIEGNQANCRWDEGGKTHEEAVSLALLNKPKEDTKGIDPFFGKTLFQNSNGNNR